MFRFGSDKERSVEILPSVGGDEAACDADVVFPCPRLECGDGFPIHRISELRSVHRKARREGLRQDDQVGFSLDMPQLFCEIGEVCRPVFPHEGSLYHTYS